MQGSLSSFQLSGGREVLGVLFELLLWRGKKLGYGNQGQNSPLK